MSKSMIRSLLVALLLRATSALADTHYVDINSTNPVSPYTNWMTSATNIQDAVDVAEDGDTVLVSNGVYRTGARATPGHSLSNRVVITNNILVRSVNGPAATVIEGQGPLGSNAVRCVFITNGVLEGFTLTNGFTQISMAADYNSTGGGAWAHGATLTNCVLNGNSASSFGGGAYRGTLYNCVLRGNSASHGGGAYSCTLHTCVLNGNSAEEVGGGACFGTLYNCTLNGNRANNDSGGGAYSCTLSNCVLNGNSAGWYGGGAAWGKLYNCTLSGNEASASGGGTSWGARYNCIVYYNSAASGSNYHEGSLVYCCTTPLPGGTGNITNEPRFVATNDFHLRYGSPCIDRGTNLAQVTEDIEGTPRPLDGDFDGVARHDIGAYEYNPEAADSDQDGMPDRWEHCHRLNPTNAADAELDADADGLLNWQEWVADTDPTNAASCFCIQAISNLPLIRVFFDSSSTRLYTLYFRTNLLSDPWTNVLGQTRIPGSGGPAWLYDTNAGPSPRYYRLGVDLP